MQNVKILVVEDEAIIAEDLKLRLKRHGYSVPSVVASGEEAIRKAGEDNPDLILMDIVLQGEMDGIEAAGQIRSRFGIPVIYVSAYADESILERAKKTFPYGYMIKPIEDKALNSSIEMALYKRKAERESRKN